MIPDLLGRFACVDIETTGLSSITDRITAIAVYDGTETHSFVKGENLEEFTPFIAQFPACATFNGRWFDAGMHITSRRELIILPEGGIVIDNPGLREIQVWADEATLNDTFTDIEGLALNCKYGDCGHTNEPECA